MIDFSQHVDGRRNGSMKRCYFDTVKQRVGLLSSMAKH